ncbi:unnamed protein product [Rotaria magnacalcarata]|uniref:Uncharacterized protein n=1 Tax=Rotaria magnacalcarata TaxID=392030 RepID=A0A816C056_9BILA|nr:unnamed protein product [Rotaria magnacalcarata]
MDELTTVVVVVVVLLDSVDGIILVSSIKLVDVIEKVFVGNIVFVVSSMKTVVDIVLGFIEDIVSSIISSGHFLSTRNKSD